jgi:hypothetical protein
MAFENKLKGIYWFEFCICIWPVQDKLLATTDDSRLAYETRLQAEVARAHTLASSHAEQWARPTSPLINMQCLGALAARLRCCFESRCHTRALLVARGLCRCRRKSVKDGFQYSEGKVAKS